MTGVEEVAAIAAIAGAGATIYSASQAGKGIPSAPKAPVLPKMPDTKSVQSNAAQADIRARSAGGTILSDQKANQGIGDGANAVRKTLLGT